MAGGSRRLSLLPHEASGPKVGQTVTLDDQFGADTVRVERPHRFCNPVEKTSAAGRFRIEERAVHLTCYEIFAPQKTMAQTFGVLNQFENDVFTITSFQLLCIPAAKLGFTPSRLTTTEAARHRTGRRLVVAPST